MEDTEVLRKKLIQFIISRFRNITGVNTMAEDIVNQAFVNCKKSRYYKPENENFGYLSKIAFNIASKLYRAQIEEKHNIPFEEAELFAFDVKQYDEFNNIEEKEFIDESLKNLREIERRVIYLRYYKDYTFSEICDRTGINLNTLLSHHRRALERLRPVFTKYFQYEENEKNYFRESNGSKHFTLL